MAYGNLLHIDLTAFKGCVSRAMNRCFGENPVLELDLKRLCVKIVHELEQIGPKQEAFVLSLSDRRLDDEAKNGFYTH